MKIKKLMRIENSYEFPGWPRPGSWGKYLYFDDGSVEFDPNHSQADAIIAATRTAARMHGLPNADDATFYPGIVGKTEDGRWLPIEQRRISFR